MSEHGPLGNEGYCKCGYFMRQSLDVCVPELQERLAALLEIEKAARELLPFFAPGYHGVPLSNLRHALESYDAIRDAS